MELFGELGAIPHSGGGRGAALWRVPNHPIQACRGRRSKGGASMTRKEKTRQRGRVSSYYRMSSGGGLRPLVPWLVT